MSTRATILEALKTCLQGITVANGYNQTVNEVKRGIHLADDMPNKPAISFWNDRGPRKDFTGEQAERTLHVWLWAYVNIQPGVYTPLDNLLADTEKRLMTRTAWAYRDDTRIGDVATYEGGASDPIGIFEMELFIEYEYTMTNP